MDSLIPLLSLNLALAVILMIAVWLLSLRLRDVSIVDIAWGTTGALIALNTFFLAGGALHRRLLVTAMTVVWGCRLSFHIARRWKGKGEDFRYAAMRAERPGSFPLRSLVTVFLLQALLICAERIGDVVPHRIHRMMGFVAVKGPVSRRIRDEFNITG